MERDKEALGKSGSRNSLNVASEKMEVEEMRAQVHSDISRKALKESLVTSPKFVSSPGISGQIEESDLAIGETVRLEDSTENVGRDELEGNSCEKLEEELGESNLVSSSLSSASDATLLGLSENVEWIRRNFKRPLALAMRDILARKPSDPIDFLASWLLNYRNTQEKLQLRQEQDRELMEERRKIRQSLSESSSKNEEPLGIKKTDWDEEMYEEDEGIIDSNFQNYIE